MTPRHIIPISLLSLALACDSSSGPGKSDVRIAAVPPAHFSAAPFAMIEGSLIARVTGADNRALPGVEVQWSTEDGTVTANLDRTDEQGQVYAIWTLGWRPGLQHARATALGSEAPAVFEASVEGFRAQGLSTGDGSHQCGIDLEGFLFCWGENEDGELGDGTTTVSNIPVRVALSQTVSQVVTGYLGQFTCALTSSGEVYCWGSNSFGQLGNGTTASSPTPVRALVPGTVKSLSAIGPGGCAVAVSGDAYCWGSNAYGRFGTGTDEATISTPTKVNGGLLWRHIALGDDRACGVTEERKAYCWGREDVELGTGVDTSTVSPLPVVNAPPMDSLTLSGWHQCGLTSDNRTYCWGTNNNIGFVDQRVVIPEPTALTEAPPFRSIHSIFKPTFGLGVDGKGYWWRPPPYATGGRPVTPESFSGEIQLRAIGTSDDGVCGIEKDTSTVYCWNSFSWDDPAVVSGVPVP